MKALLLEMRSTLNEHRPNLGLARISSQLKREGYEVLYHVATKANPFPVTFEPDRLVVSLTFSWDIRDTVAILTNLFSWYPGLKERTVIGGVATTMNRDILVDQLGIEPEMGCNRSLDAVVADPEFYADRDETYLFTSRGCGNRCSFCCVPHIEPSSYVISNWKEQIDMTKKTIVLCDNNILLADPEHKRQVFEHLAEIAPVTGRRVDGRRVIRTVEFDGGLDHRQLMNPENLELMSKVRFSSHKLAFDNVSYEKVFHQAAMNLIPLLGKPSSGIFKNTNIYTLYGCDDTNDTPADTLYRVYKLRYHYGFQPWLMRYIPLNAMEYKKYVAPNWTVFVEDLKDMGQWVNNRYLFGKMPEYIHYLGNTKATGLKVIYEGLTLDELSKKYGLDFFTVRDRLDFSKGYAYNQGLLEEQIARRHRNMDILRGIGSAPLLATA